MYRFKNKNENCFLKIQTMNEGAIMAAMKTMLKFNKPLRK